MLANRSRQEDYLASRIPKDSRTEGLTGSPQNRNGVLRAVVGAISEVLVNDNQRLKDEIRSAGLTRGLVYDLDFPDLPFVECNGTPSVLRC